ncbi:MAG: hypothetical protein Q8P30_00785, partial [Candidatus Uhrbacteria bacterium]|nr:hypothetical protein [Candidatus Uhrbacteria bacterium]
MSDGEDKRRATRNWREYKEEMRESYRVYAWVWRELVSIEAKQWYKKMSVALVVEVSLALSVPFAVSLVINGLVQHDYKKVAVALVAVFSALALERVAAHFVMVYREWILGINYGTLDKRTSELFFEKSMGQHQQENSSLSASNVEKGRGRVIELQNMMLFEGEHTLIILAVSFALLWLITPVAGMVMTLMMLIIIAWSMFMNQRVSETMAPVDKEMRALNRYRVERWDQVARVKSNAKEVEEVTTIVDWFNRIVLADRTFWLWYIKNLTGRGILTVVALVCSLLYGVWLVWNGVWEVGLLYPLFTWASNVKDTVWRIGHIEHQLNWNMPSVRSLMEALSIVPDVV